MPAQILDGKALAQTMQAEIAAQVAEQVRTGGPRPGLAAVRVGDDPASEIYVRNKTKACEKAGIASFQHHLPGTTTQPQLLQVIARLNTDPAVHGILVQLPLPKQIDANDIIAAVDPRKDVDGFHPENLGLLAAGAPRFVACTPLGVQQLLVRNGIEIAGSRVVILGRSLTVGKPLALLLMCKGAGGDATVTVAHSKSHNLAQIARSADILIAAMGQARFVTAAMVQPGAAVIDVGITRLPDGKLAGDVDFDAVKQIARAITPVPGGVGPMTITMLLHNTLLASRLSRSGSLR
ncbi:MAG TPA: bifunctional methylenetetrahydrofolate dehydrogenase/methenyltetrahydrofolate cyclohydrolase FolD [Gemmataceae bacterium]|jgi:methylenetetrahydrofolate dehydrogenase (NADP+)/methenyltetrahydrofolate cyclohydrolase|nr:bifunctional methylenetetrahydrofolate dehydrogenase/methenyltetrahydrofolate cyclohydrolase FolD [Gemmataceae bacterium]